MLKLKSLYNLTLYQLCTLIPQSCFIVVPRPAKVIDTT